MSSGTTHKGSITLDFKSEKAFTTFGYQWMKCNTHFEVRGEIEKPEITGKWQYNVPYKLECRCENVLRDFEIAYQGAFKPPQDKSRKVGRMEPYNYDQAPLHKLGNDDFNAALNSCALPRGQVDIDDTYWNIGFTNMIRQTNAAAWGNWSLNPSIVPGAVGILNPQTGSFTQVATIPNATVTTLASPEEWSVESSSVHRTESQVDFKGGYLDPSSGTEVKVGLDVGWTFASEGSLVSNATVTGRAQVDDFGTVMAANYAWLLARAAEVGYATDEGIVQGFGMITVVQNCAGGINIGSLNEDSSFSLTGSVDGVNAMTGGGDVNVGVKGSYKETNQTKAFESHLWPADANATASGEVGIDYQFASYAGKLIMPTWIMELSGFSVAFDNHHGGTYIGDCSVQYDCTVDGSTQTLKKQVSVPGGQSRTIDGIPLDATNMVILVHFEAGDDFYFRYAKPLTAMLAGACTIDMSGVWPWGSHAKIRIAS